MASILPDYEYDIFLSYRQKDNRSDQWVTNFVKALKEELDATFKEEVSIYFDSNPHDGLLETHDVDGSLKGKIKCLIFIPIVSQTYCDPKSFAWQKEFLAFINFVNEDKVGLDIKLSNGNVAKRVLPVRIHEIDEADKKLFEDAIGGVLRPVDFIFKSAGVNRPLRSNEDHPQDNTNKTYYRDQINKVANAIKEIITSMRVGSGSPSTVHKNIPKPTSSKAPRMKILIAAAILLIILVGFFYYKNYSSVSMDASQASIAVIPFLNNTGNANIEWYGLGIANEIRTQLSLSKQFDFISSMQATMEFKNSDEPPKAMGEKLGVTHILSGVYQQINNEIKVIVELVDSSTGKIVWSLPYNTTLADVGNLQASIAKEVIKKFQGNANNVHSVKINMQAFSEVSIGNELLLKSFNNDLMAADHFRNAIKIDSAFFPAWAGLVRALSKYSFYHRNDSLIKKEVQSSLSYVDAHFEGSWEKSEVQANYKYHGEGKYEEAKELFLKVLQENPDAETSNYLLANIYKRQLKLSPALKYMQKAIKLRNTPSHMADLGQIYNANGEYDKAEAAWQSALANGIDVAGGIYNLHYLRNTLNSLPPEVKRKVGNRYYSDSLLLKRDYRGMSNFLRKISPDSLFNQEVIIEYKLYCHYSIKEDDSVLYYARKWDTKNQDYLLLKSAILTGESGLDELIKTFPIYSGDLTINAMIECVKIQLAVLVRDYKKATQLLKGLNKNFPDYGNYLFLNDPVLDRIKEEYPPFNEAIKNLKLPPKLSDAEIVKM